MLINIWSHILSGLEFSLDDLENQTTLDQALITTPVSYRASSRTTGRPITRNRPRSRYNSEHCINQSSDKCVGNNLRDLYIDTTEHVDEHAKKESNVLEVIQGKDETFDTVIRENQDVNLDNFLGHKLGNTSNLPNNINKKRTSVEGIKREKTKQMSMTLAGNYALPSEISTLSNKHFDFALQRGSGTSTYVISNYASPSGGCKKKIGFANARPVQNSVSQAPIIALQRSKTIYKNQYLPSVQSTRHRSPPRIQHDAKVMIISNRVLSFSTLGDVQWISEM